MKPQKIPSVIHTQQRHYNADTSRSPAPSYPYYRPNSYSTDMSAPSDERRRSYASSHDGGIGPYNGDSTSTDAQHAMLLDGVVEEIDLDKDQFEREELKALQAKDKKLKVGLCLARFTTRLINLIGSILVTAFLTEVMQFYMKSADLKTSVGRPGTAPYITAWPSEPYLLPAYIMMGSAFATLFLNFSSIMASCCDLCLVKVRRSTGIDVFSCVCTVAHVVVWAVAVGAYHGLRNGKDLYSYSCSRLALARTRHFPDLDFDFSCAGHKLVFWTAFTACVFNIVAMAEIVPVYMRRKLTKDLKHLEKLKV
ncbi:hypothetical protein TWF696_006035 [Orbilia brochopaga]|uniref:Uncharacterized protein n=1 Tax=Orbilia brochopaga TaxID=3140254 RepID=A0AAV9UXE6_9PEZI